MSLSTAKAKLDAQPGDPATGYISKQDHKDSYDELVADTALTGATTAAGITVSGAVQVGATAGLVVGASGPKVLSGSGSPEGAVTAPVGSIFLRTDGGADTAAYYKTSGTGNTGWTAADTGTGDVVGPASATDNAVARFDGTTGKLVQNSGVIVDDSNNVSGVGTLGCGAITSTGDLLVNKADASLTVGSGSGASLAVVRGAAGQSRQVRLQAGTARRWDFGANTTAESGSSAGSDFVLTSHSDGGVQTTVILATRSTGKVTLGSVGATAGLELGSSGPRMMSGTGSPEGAVTAPVGSIWFQTDSTLGVTHWRKSSGTGNTGWVVMEGDTGWRSLAASATPHANTTLTYLRVRRRGGMVALTYYLSSSVSVTDALIYDALPVGFRPPFQVATIRNRGGILSSGDQIVWDIRSGGQVYYSSAGGSIFQGEVVWTTDDAWPTALPGTAV